jgi:hypothetical protein
VSVDRHGRHGIGAIRAAPWPLTLALLPFGAYPFLAITLLGWAWRTSGRDRRGTMRRERGTPRSNVRDSAR